VALEWGRLRDRRAVDPLMHLLHDRSAKPALRAEAAQLLGMLADPRSQPSLVRALHDDTDPRIAAEAAISLGRMFDPAAQPTLRRLVDAEDPDLRVRAAVSLGRLHDPAAVPALSEALWIAQGDYEREEAIRWLGRLRDRRALEPLIQLLPQQRTRYLVVVAMGMLGDERAFEPLSDVLAWDTHSNVQDSAVRGLALLGDPRAIDEVLPLAVKDPAIKQAAESLVRLGAIGLGKIGGVDVARANVAASDFGSCHEGPLLHDWDFEHRTYCTTRKTATSLTLQVPATVASAPNGSVLVLTAQRTDAAAAAPLQVKLGALELPPVQVDGSWTEYRWPVPAESLREGRVKIHLTSSSPSARFALDHALLLPVGAELLAQRVQ